MKNLFLVAVTSLFLAGCASTPPSQTTIARITGLSELAAYEGASIDLVSNPTHKPAYVAAIAAIDALVSTNNFDPSAFAAALQALPIKELHGQQGSLIVNGAIILWQEYAAETVNLDQTVYIKPVMLAVRRGLARAIN